MAIAALLLGLAMTSVSPAPHTPDCFADMGPVMLPERHRVLGAVSHGETGRAMAQAVLDGDIDTVRRLAAADPQALEAHVPPAEYPDFTPDGQFGDLLVLSVARCDRPMLNALLAAGLSPDGAIRGAALDLSVKANTPDFMVDLLDAGADPDPQASGAAAHPMRTAAERGNLAAARLLLHYGADVHWANALGYTALHDAVSMDAMAVAELLIEAGADPWRTSRVGAMPAHGIAMPLQVSSDADAEARDRLVRRLQASAAGWPPPDPQTVRRLALQGEWPGAERRAAGVPPLPDGAIEYIREHYAPDGSAR